MSLQGGQKSWLNSYALKTHVYYSAVRYNMAIAELCCH